MSGEARRARAAGDAKAGGVTASPSPDHPVRAALLGLLATSGTVTSTEAARRLELSSGITSFHLRRLARDGRIEEAPARDRRARPWRLAGPRPAGSSELDRELSDEAYQRWLAQRGATPDGGEAAFSAVIHVSPDQLAAVADEIRAVLARYPASGRQRRPTGAMVRLFPLLPLP